jgi:hypothetical protein
MFNLQMQYLAYKNGRPRFISRTVFSFFEALVARKEATTPNFFDLGECTYIWTHQFNNWKKGDIL